jgi:probable phosphoglycerate mutase
MSIKTGAATTTVTRVLLARHGATTLSAEDRFAGSSDVPLSEEGVEQARRLGERLRDEPIAAVYCSDMHRAMRTAEAIVQPQRLNIITRPALREMDHGQWEGLVHKDVEVRFADAYARWDADPLLSPPPGGESGLAVLARSLPELARIVNDHPAQTVAVVSHKATNRLMLCAILGIDPRFYRARIGQDLACLNIIEFRSPANGRVVLMNDTSHCRGIPHA